MTFDLDEAVQILERTPATLKAMLCDLPESWLRTSEGEGTWSPFDVVGHLIDGEQSDWIPRARIILEHGEARAFEPFDRFAHLEANRGASLDELLERFAELRARNLESLAELGPTPEMLERRGRHPEFGPVTLRQLLATWVAHDLSHLGQIVRVMARRYGAEVGPWKAYLPLIGS